MCATPLVSKACLEMLVTFAHTHKAAQTLATVRIRLLFPPIPTAFVFLSLHFSWILQVDRMVARRRLPPMPTALLEVKIPAWPAEDGRARALQLVVSARAQASHGSPQQAEERRRRSRIRETAQPYLA